ncbi:MAG TPA: tetratricopeptide repeat protein [Actinomycetota bacterium]|nr:tetratricopeptide repeat protein [Actinomycetota bacterium]
MTRVSESSLGSSTTFVGRERELREIAEALRSHRLVTVWGAGGSGKTRLAHRTAQDLSTEWPDGAWFVELAPLAEAEDLAPTVGAVLGLRDVSGGFSLRAPDEVLVDFLRPKQLLLVLDACQHVLPAATRLVEAVLRSCPGVRILATTRDPFGLTEEMNWRVPPLSLPGATADVQGDSVELFLQRVKEAAPQLLVGEAEMARVRGICLKLQGVPLALELAAARTRDLPLEDIDARLGDAVPSAPADEDQVPRRQIVQSTVEWSYKLLDPLDASVLQRVSVFAAGFPAEAAQRVAADRAVPWREIAQSVSRLVDASLVVSDPRSGRYRLLDSVRLYASTELASSGEFETINDRHLQWFADLAERVEPHLFGAEDIVWLERLEDDLHNLRQALVWASGAGSTAEGLRLAGALWLFWIARGYRQEALRGLEALLDARGEVEPVVRARAISCAGDLMFVLGRDRKRARELLEQAVESLEALLGSQLNRLLCMTMLRLAHASGGTGDVEAMGRWADRGLELARRLDDPYCLAEGLWVSGLVEQALGRPGEARDHFERMAGAAGRAGGFLRYQAQRALGTIAYGEGDFATARRHFEKALSEAHRRDDRHAMSVTLNALSLTQVEQGDLEAAEVTLNRYKDLVRDQGDDTALATVLNQLGYVCLARGQVAGARSHFQEALRLYSEAWDALGTASVMHSLGEAAQAAGDLAGARQHFEEALSEYRDLGSDPGVALVLDSLGSLCRAEGSIEPCMAMHLEALSLRTDFDLAPTIRRLAAAASLATDFNRAARLIGAAERLATEPTRLDPVARTEYEQTVESAREALGADAFERESAAGAAMSTAQVRAFAAEVRTA